MEIIFHREDGGGCSCRNGIHSPNYMIAQENTIRWNRILFRRKMSAHLFMRHIHVSPSSSDCPQYWRCCCSSTPPPPPPPQPYYEFMHSRDTRLACDDITFLGRNFSSYGRCQWPCNRSLLITFSWQNLHTSQITIDYVIPSLSARQRRLFPVVGRSFGPTFTSTVPWLPTWLFALDFFCFSCSLLHTLQ
jgi:hypothetical protein